MVARSFSVKQKPTSMKQLFQNVFFKMGMIAILILLLLIPAIMVQNLIHERMMRQNEAVEEVSSKHARSQTIIGPVLSIPFEELRSVKEPNGNVKQVKERRYFHVLPEELNVQGSVSPQKRKRGIFEVVVYSSKLDFKGNFDKINFEQSGIKPEQLLLGEAFVTVGIPDLKGIKDQVKFQFNDSSRFFNPGVLNEDFTSSGLHVNVALTELDEKQDFAFELKLDGSEQMMFSPIGKVTSVKLNSPWTEPSFDGEFLPEIRKVSKKGFEAEWKILHLNRNFPQQWVGQNYSIGQTLFGVNLKLPVDVYQKSMRVAKYAVLFIVLTYLVFFFVEILNRILIHPIQYILVGIALILFYVLMLAFSEQIYFDYAYLLAALMTISLILFYCKSILKSWALAGMTAAILVILYSFIFIIIQLQDYALLFGSLGVFLILAVTMYFSRKIDWFNIKGEEN